MSGVLAIGRAPGPYLDRIPHVLVAAPEEVVDAPATMHAFISDGLGEEGVALILLPEALAAPAGRTIATVSSALGSPALLTHATALPPLAGDVLVTLAAALVEPLGGVEQVAAVLPLLEHQILQYTWLSSLSKLRDPAPTVWQHARSSLPGTAWLVSSWPEPLVQQLQDDAVVRVPSPAQQVGVAAADLGGDTTWIDTRIVPHLPDVVGVAVPPPPDTAQWWGSKRVTQIAVYPRDVTLLADALRPHLDPGTCSWCRRRVGAPMCPWCHLPRSGLTRSDIDVETPVVGGVYSSVPDGTRSSGGAATQRDRKHKKTEASR